MIALGCTAAVLPVALLRARKYHITSSALLGLILRGTPDQHASPHTRLATHNVMDTRWRELLPSMACEATLGARGLERARSRVPAGDSSRPEGSPRE